MALIAGIFTFFSAFDEAHELQDDVLRQVATLFDQRRLSLPEDRDRGGIAAGDPESRIFVQPLPMALSGRSDNGARPLLALPQNLLDGMQTVRAGDEAYRVLVHTLGTGQRLAVAQETAVRDEIAWDSALRTVMPFLVLIPILLLIVADFVRKIFRPVADLAVEIDQRGEHELQPIPAGPLPVEIRPFVAAINRLLRRVEQSMDIQRRFVADASHELRSPLTALSLQAERLADTDMSAVAQERLSEVDLVTLVKNLVDNAIRYTPAGGGVDLSVSTADGVTILAVGDNGPGIPEPARERVFDPFYRVLGSDQIGSGLGLSIVRTIAAVPARESALASPGNNPGPACGRR